MNHPSPTRAGLRRRLASLLYESLLLLGVWAGGFMLPYLIVGVGLKITPPGWVLWLHTFALFGIYFIYYWRHGGQTLAMQTWRIKVVDAVSGDAPDWAHASLRYALSWPSLMFFGAGLLWSLFDRDGQFLHDRLSRTRVVQLPRTTA